MKIKTFHIRLSKEHINSDENKLNDFLKDKGIIDTFAELVKTEKVDKQTKVVKYIYTKTGDDHYRHATNYAWLASTKIGLSEENVSYGKLPKCFRHTRKNWMTM